MTAESKPLTGNWSRLAFDNLKEQFSDNQALLNRLLSTQHQGILDGVVPINIPIHQVVDEIGSDRLADEQDGADGPDRFRALVDNIGRRGQQTPIRVRPASPQWRPRGENPFDVADTMFALQSGRRRLAACRELGLDHIRAFISFPDDAKTRTNDLEERFFENAVRRDLTAFEKLFSIGMIAAEMDGMTGTDIAEALHVAMSDVSKGVAVVANYDALKGVVDMRTASYRDIENALKAVKAPKGQKSNRPPTDRPPLPFEEVQLERAELKLKQNTRGVRQLTIKGDALSDELIQKIHDLIQSQK